MTQNQEWRPRDVLVYAPVGLVLSAGEAVPRLVERGRRHVDDQVRTAHAIGQFALRQGRSGLDKVGERARHQLLGVLDQLGLGALRGEQGQKAAPPTPERSAPTAPAGPPPPGSGPAAAGLAIPDYDSLSASQVVPRLSGLSAAELDAVRSYESDHRGRRTILNKVDQLQGA